MKTKRLILVIVFLNLFLFSMFTVYIFKKETQKIRLPVLGTVHDFLLYDTKAKEFQLKDLDNKIWIANFIFTTCGGICPIMSKNMAALHRSYFRENDIEVVSFTVNPENDSPEVLAQYAQKLNADTSKWHFLTGSRETITDLAVNSFKIGSVAEPIFHSGYFILIDKKAQIRGYYDGTEQEAVRKLFKDVAQLLKES